MRPIETPFDQRVQDFRQRVLPIVVWTLCAGVCAWMMIGRAQKREYIALAQSMDYEISSPATGTIETVFVDLYQSVSIGDVVARLDDSQALARLERSHASIRQLRAELIAARARLQADNEQGIAAWTNDLRRFQTDEEDRRLMSLELRAQIEADEIELERLNIQVERLDPLARSGLVDLLTHDEIELLRDQVRTRLEENGALLDQTEREHRAARNRRLEFEANLPSLPQEEPFLAPLREAISVESQRLREIEALREALVLRSPIEGQISQLFCSRGQAVTPGEPVATVTDPVVRDIVAFLDVSDPRVVAENAPVRLSSLDRPGHSAESFVVRVGASVQPLPERLWREPGVPTYGRAVVIAALPDMGLRPGERLNVHFSRR